MDAGKAIDKTVGNVARFEIYGVPVGSAAIALLGLSTIRGICKAYRGTATGINYLLPAGLAALFGAVEPVKGIVGRQLSELLSLFSTMEALNEVSGTFLEGEKTVADVVEAFLVENLPKPQGAATRIEDQSQSGSSKVDGTTLSGIDLSGYPMLGQASAADVVRQQIAVRSI